MVEQNKIRVEVAYAKPEEQVIIPIDVDPGTTLDEAIRISGILEHFPEIELAQNRTGIFGKIADPDTVLQERDRVEIYRPLIADPKESRRKRAAKKGAQSASGAD
ncbi:MAG: RnfH family protein [Proteobacteria bacterium]|jgi:hypothetical protein|nr:RnfH family protein [Pseudomonadota bacterium]